LVSCCAARRSWSASRRAAASRSSASDLVELLELHHPHVVGLAGGVGADALGVALGLGPDLLGLPARGVAHVGGLVLGELEHRRRATAQPGVRRAADLGDLGTQALELLLELDDALLAAGQAGGQPGLLGLELPDALVDRSLVVAAAAHDRQRGCGRGRRDGRRRGRGAR
jgi:hypothetical protein